ncbi:MAG: hypothetical protein M3295_06140, partial [Chloroflexota bacterium]|nr:hypothetical protein [Chloroflexota bacterium]
RWMLVLLVPFFALWANLHGLYVAGLGAVLVYVLFTLAGRTPMAASRRWVVGAGSGAVLASAVTPAGPAGLLYPLRYVDSGDWGLANIQEWQSPNFHEPAHLLFLGLIVLVAWNGARATPGWLATLSFVGLAAGLVALRNVPIAAILSVPTLALGIDARMNDRWPRLHVAARQMAARRWMEMGLTLIVIVAAAVVLLPRASVLRSTAPPADRFPVAGIDALGRRDPDARLLAEYGWAGYAISRLYERGGRVFVDGRNDMYDETILDDYSAIRDADPGWGEFVERYAVEAILLPPDATLTRGPATDAGWCEAYRDDVQVLLLRSCEP